MASIEKIQINNFKSHKKFINDLSNDPQQIVVYGENGVGKTNLIEALSFFSNSKGLRGDNIEKVITNHDQAINTNNPAISIGPKMVSNKKLFFFTRVVYSRCIINQILFI